MSGVGFFFFFFFFFFIIVVEGEASVLVDEREVARLGPGDHFGELALIARERGPASVRSETPLRCLEVTFWDFRRAARDSPDIAWKLLQHLVGVLTEERLRQARAFAQSS
ncbi:MAG: cyclic nucleotide-binding domain-containing protein [Gaiellaceae bacterium]